MSMNSLVLPQDDVSKAIENFFLIRQFYFQANPLEKTIFETIMLHGPNHLKDQIHQLRQPLRALNRAYLIKQISKLKLRDGLNHIEVMHYPESMAQLFPTLMQSYLDKPMLMRILC